MKTTAPRHRHTAAGFTLLELLVAITVLSIVSMIAWRGLDSLIGTRARLDPETEAVRTLLTVFGQVERDLANAASPTLFGVSGPSLRVRQSVSEGTVFDVLRLAPVGDGEAAAIQTVTYQVTDRVLWRRSSPPARAFNAQDADKLTNVQLLTDVKAMRLRLWMDGAQAWTEPGAESTPVAPGVPMPRPAGIEFTIELGDGKTYRRVVLVG
jgi:general secretion pathway protein J